MASFTAYMDWDQWMASMHRPVHFCKRTKSHARTVKMFWMYCIYYCACTMKREFGQWKLRSTKTATKGVEGKIPKYKMFKTLFIQCTKFTTLTTGSAYLHRKHTDRNTKAVERK